MAEERNDRRPRSARQEWKPHWFLVLLKKAWMIAFGAAKIAVGAAATVLIICLVCGLVFAGILGDYLEEDVIPFANYDPERSDLEEISTIYCVDRDTGDIQVYQKIYASISREWASYDEIPEDLVHAAVAIEDKRFYEHQGVDWVTTIKACLRMFVGDASAGGSSITQQLLKNLTQDDSVTVQRKVREIFRAVNFEKKYDKQTIMTYYLNTIYFGQGCGGVKTAAETYFGKELQSLTTAECASLISITNNPSLFDPYGEEFEYEGEMMTGMERNRTRQMKVLGEMLDQGWITQEEYDEAVAQEIVLKNGIDDEDKWAVCPNEDCGYQGIVSSLDTDGELYYCPECGTEVPVEFTEVEGMYSWMTDTVLEDVGKAMAANDGVEWTDETKKIYMNIIQTGGYSIYCTVDPKVQEQIDKIYTDLSQVPSVRSANQLQSAIVIIDNQTGDIAGMAGKVGEKTYYDELNIATDSELQSGSSIKPLTVYAPAFEIAGISPATVIKDLPLNYDDGAYPLNAERYYSYRSTILNGITNSINAVAANTLDMIGLGYSFSFAKDQFGLSTLVESYVDSSGTVHSDQAYGPLALGAQTFGVTVRDMSAAFATFSNNGVYREARTFTKVYDRNGNLVLDNTQEEKQIISRQTANYINYCLNNAVVSGTGSAANFSGMEICGKTGTTGDNKDRWFCGYTGYYTAAVWCGFEQPEQIVLVGDTTNPAIRMWKKVMEPLHADLPYKAVVDTTGMREVEVCLESGKLATDACALDIRGISTVRTALCYPEDMPEETCDSHVVVDYCVTGGGVATEYCKLFAEAGQAEIEQKALVKMTQAEIEEIRQAASYNLNSNYLQDNYIYLVNSDGSDGIFTGISGDLRQSTAAPYVICPVHTKAAWEAYEAAHPSAPSLPNLSDIYNWLTGGGVTEDNS